MISAYRYTGIGRYHEEAGLPCQDFCAIEHVGDFAVAAVADGVGSCGHSALGAEEAVRTAVACCAGRLRSDMDASRLIGLMTEAFFEAYRAVAQRALKEGIGDVKELDTTLTLALWDGSRLAWGQAGDSGMIVARGTGEYLRVAEQQRDGEGRVYTLRCGPDTWEFGVEDDIAAVLLATDGLYERICHPLLGYRDEPIDVGLAAAFMHHEGGDGEEAAAWRARTDEFIEGSRRMRTDDDRTLVVLWDADRAPARRDPGYYETPDWEGLAARRRERIDAIFSSRV